MDTTILNGDWRLVETGLDWGGDRLTDVLAMDGLSCALPCDVHMPLQAAGRIGDVVVGMNSFDAEWTQTRAWWFVKRFDYAPEDADRVEITFEMIDTYADIFLNGRFIGHSENAFAPFVADVRDMLRAGENTLAVRVTTGLENVCDADLALIDYKVCTEASNGRLDRGDKRRAFVRRPQYSSGWDWSGKAATCGIAGDVKLRAHRKLALRGVHAHTLSIGSTARVAAEAEIELFDPVSTAEGAVRFSVLRDGEVVARAEIADALLVSGVNFFDAQLDVPDARLWWPNGYGAQPLYELRVEVSCGDARAEIMRAFGIRTISLDLSKRPDGCRDFTFVVNGVRIFAKGGDWVPADMIYARVGETKYRALVREARDAHFNMLRVWGGGLYEPDCFYDACDQMGILVWQDYMFGCAAYPDMLEWFRRESRREIEYQTRRLRTHACLALFCGNNENQCIFPTAPGLYEANYIAPRVVRAACPEIPYWNSSPYGGKDTSDERVGDVHHWGACMMNPDMTKRIEPREYDKVRARFVSEYGYPGPCPVESMQTYLGGDADRAGRAWAHHTNTFEKDTVAAGVMKRYGLDAQSMSLEDYALYAGLAQMHMLEYSLEALRFRPECDGSLFWMYNDAWGEVGWSIVDYALRRKISYYGVARAFAPVKLTLRKIGGKAVLQGCNDTDCGLSIQTMVGYCTYDGAVTPNIPKSVLIPARSKGWLMEFELPQYDPALGAFVVLPEGEDVAPAVLYETEIANCLLPGARIRTLSETREGDARVVRLAADGYAHGVYLEGDFRCSDQYFDLLPGQTKRVRVLGEGDMVWRSVR